MTVSEPPPQRRGRALIVGAAAGLIVLACGIALMLWGNAVAKTPCAPYPAECYGMRGFGELVVGIILFIAGVATMVTTTVLLIARRM